MPTEIERKFLLADDSWRESAHASARFRQGYLSTSGRSAIRVRVSPEKSRLTIKSSDSGMVRAEYEYDVPRAHAEEMLDTLCIGSIIEKTRHLIKHGRHTWEVDVFEGDNNGLILAEVELEDSDEVIEHPNWLGREVTGDVRYYNAYLAEHPYCQWPKNV